MKIHVSPFVKIEVDHWQGLSMRARFAVLMAAAMIEDTIKANERPASQHVRGEKQARSNDRKIIELPYILADQWTGDNAGGGKS